MAIYYEKKSGTKAIADADRVHELCVVDGVEERGRDNKFDGSAIQFDKSIPPAVAASLTRLHQNLDRYL